jgi:hypothetical protein
MCKDYMLRFAMQAGRLEPLSKKCFTMLLVALATAVVFDAS